MKLRFTPRALENLEVISSYLRSKNPAASLHVRAAIYESLQSLILFPRLGRPQKAKGIRKLVIPNPADRFTVPWCHPVRGAP